MALEKKDKKPVICAQGKTFNDVARFSDRFGNVIDLTGYTASLQVRDSLPDPDDPSEGLRVALSSEVSSDDGSLEFDLNSGLIRITISATKTATFPVGSLVWELELTGPGGFVPYFMAPSKFKVEAEANV